MQRVSGYSTDSWCDKTMSVLVERQITACQERLSLYPANGIYSGITETDFDMLWRRSYYAAEKEVHLPTPALAGELVLSRLSREACYLSQTEHALTERMLCTDGTAEITGVEEISAAEALIRRLWCTLRVDGERAFIRLEDALYPELLKAWQTETHTRIREKLFAFNATVEALLYVSGFLFAGVPAEHFLDQEGETADAQDKQLMMRYMMATFDYTVSSGGDILLVHPGLAEPEALIGRLMLARPQTPVLTGDMLLGAMNGILPEERAVCEMMRGALQGALRPGYELEEALCDLRMLAKQGVPFDELTDVLSGMLCVMPTAAMRESLRLLYIHTVRWAGMPSAVLN